MLDSWVHASFFTCARVTETCGGGCAVATREKTVVLCLRIFVLLTLCTLLNAIICCLQLNTQGGSDDSLRVDY